MIEYITIFWGIFMVSMMAIGGYFMFRKFLKQLPKEDGTSDMYWEEYYMEKTLHMWKDDEKVFLEELVSPVPQMFRDVARQKIASKIGQVALEKGEKYINRDILIEGYILATPKRDHKFLRKKLKQHDIDVTPYEDLFELSPKDYSRKKQLRKVHNK